MTFPIRGKSHRIKKRGGGRRSLPGTVANAYSLRPRTFESMMLLERRSWTAGLRSGSSMQPGRRGCLTANRAEIDEETGDLMVAGNVLLASTDSTRLETDTLRWLREDEKVSGDGQVTIRRPDGRETGVGFEATSDLKRWTLHRVTTHLARADTL